MSKLRYGHAPEHVRQTFVDAAEAFRNWDGQSPEPTVLYEINFLPREITISKACGLVWNCTDVIPCSAFYELQDLVDVKRHTYAACARAILATIKASD